LQGQQEHIVKSFDDQLKNVAHQIARMGGMAESQFSSAVDALARRDSDLAGRVVNADTGLDGLEQQVEEETVRILALRQPVATDLREIIAAFKIASDTERIGDYAVNVAKRTLALNQLPPAQPASAVPRMSRLVQSIVKDTFDAYVERDADKALDVWHRDAEVDEMYTSLFRELLTYMMEDPRAITPCTHLLFVAKNIERIGDHATNIAETIHYLVTGAYIEGGRPKGDTSSYAVVEAPDELSPDGRESDGTAGQAGAGDDTDDGSESGRS
jgi:phosphate transport system protein